MTMARGRGHRAGGTEDLESRIGLLGTLSDDDLVDGSRSRSSNPAEEMVVVETLSCHQTDGVFWKDGG